MDINFQGQIVGNNKRYKYRTQKVLSDEYKAFKIHLGWLAKQQRPKLDEVNEFILDLRYNSKHDIDAFKGVLDAFEGIIYKNDRQVVDGRYRKDKTLPKNSMLISINVNQMTI